MKTWSRETAFIILVFTCVLAWKYGPEATTPFMWPVVAFSIPAFGLKQESIKAFLEKGK